MINISKERLLNLKNSFNGLKIAIVGDMMLDCYFRGEVRRISPEAPVPVLEVENEFYRFGGAANVALNILKLGGIPFPIGVIGNDNDGRIFLSLAEDSKMNLSGLIIDQERPTTAKTRVIAHNQHVVRIDKESKRYLSNLVEDKLVKYMEDNISNLDGIILQDYNKGVLTPTLIERMTLLASKNKKLITVDPKFNNFFLYKNVSVIKPNRKEAEDVLGIKLKNDNDISIAGNMILEKTNASYVVLTLSEDGIAIFEKDKPINRMPTKAQIVGDVSGAGDTVISTLTMALAAKANIIEASYLANYAGGIVCEEIGIIPIQQDKLFDIIRKDKD
ncbi:MAG: D-glycero-beta-D-manno-heptose-7-phosphate kinase [Ignavibacteriaceae bacterium]|nr:D-glycero-beta-D-manno-heptose-7-phosphate kinase [Ignavibacteriaceae bacterium]